MTSQYKSGGLSRYGSAWRYGTTHSPRASISRGISAYRLSSGSKRWKDRHGYSSTAGSTSSPSKRPQRGGSPVAAEPGNSTRHHSTGSQASTERGPVPSRAAG